MPRIFGGHTGLGTELNRYSQKNSHTLIEKSNYKKAIIQKSFNGLYVFTMKMSDSGEITKPIPLLGSPEDLAMRYGSPEEMEGQWEVIISYKGTSVNRGTAVVLNRYGVSVAQESETIKSSNDVEFQGSAFAPPGPGM